MNGEIQAPTVVTLRPHAWYLAAVVGITFLAATLIVVFSDLGSALLPPASAIGAGIAMASVMRLELRPSGVSIQTAEASWDQLRPVRGRMGLRLEVPPSIEPRRRHRIKLLLSVWEPNWRDGEIGAHLARYAPDLLAQMD